MAARYFHLGMTMEPTGFKTALFGFHKADVLQFIADSNREYQQQLEEEQQQTQAVQTQLEQAKKQLEEARRQLARQQERADKMDGLIKQQNADNERLKQSGIAMEKSMLELRNENSRLTSQVAEQKKKSQALEKAGYDANTLLEEAKKRADHLVSQAKEQAEQVLEQAKQQAQQGLTAAKEKAVQLEEQGRQAAQKLQEEAMQKAAQVSQQLLEQQEQQATGQIIQDAQQEVQRILSGVQSRSAQANRRFDAFYQEMEQSITKVMGQLEEMEQRMRSLDQTMAKAEQPKETSDASQEEDSLNRFLSHLF